MTVGEEGERRGEDKGERGTAYTSKTPLTICAFDPVIFSLSKSQ